MFEKEIPKEKPTAPEQEKPYQYQILTLEHYKKHIEEEQGVIPPIYPDSEAMRGNYVARTDELIQKIEDKNINTVIFLDKSARPVSWLVREFWPIFADDKPMPERKFVHFDADFWIPSTAKGARPTSERIYNYQPPSEAIEELRDIYKDPREPNKSVFDGKNVLIVDEVGVTGTTALLAKKFFEKAFPNAKFDSAVWMQAKLFEYNRNQYPMELPVWYHETDPMGRGIGELRSGTSFRSERAAMVNENYVPITASRSMTDDEIEYYLHKIKWQKSKGYTSSGKPNPDQLFVHDNLSLALREDIKHLADDVRNKRQAIIPGMRPDSFYYEVDETGQPIRDKEGNFISKKFKIRKI